MSIITLLEEKQAARQLGVTPKALQAWRCRGGGPAYVKIGRLVRYSQDDLRSWLETRRRQNTADHGTAK